MRIYIAAPWSFKQGASHAATQVMKRGYVITSSWLSELDKDYGKGYYGDTDWRGIEHEEDLRTHSRRDLDELFESDILLLLNAASSEGKVIETGYALGHHIPIFAVGKPTNAFHYLPEFYWFNSVTEALNGIEEFYG